MARVEHVNITVSDIDRSARMLEAVFGWRRRWRGPSALGGETIHVGDDDTYLAVYQAHAGSGPAKNHAKGLPLNHVGVVVDDLDATEKRVLEYGLKPFSHADYEPGRRFYFFDPDGIEFEVVSYA